jgi:hypothetical protein
MISVNVRLNSSWFIPLVVIGACGLAGVSVDLFDILALATDGPRWLYQLDLYTAILWTLVIGCLDAYRRRRGRTRGASESGLRSSGGD